MRIRDWSSDVCSSDLAEAYAAGELKHGPLALVDANMPVIAVAPNDHLIDKLSSNMEEVRARGGRLYLFVEHGVASGSSVERRVGNESVSPCRSGWSRSP